ncbi:hypothetical protein NliqN6_5312 [Naganishia liquefaciens]|uniref:ubiquitinyl hydrolase 1 n=1 Tax=Naganishia liquefaciens TaxID=104408 RepID=A0A8H3TX95_9TREE|nr:hypothetical protein NliqN6_5312 [Naganishia liquefaciens]
MGDPYARLTLAQLREKARLTARPNDYSARSWLANAVRTADTAHGDDARGQRERAFVGYLKALQFFEAFLQHSQAERCRREAAGQQAAYEQFAGRRAELLKRARELETQLRAREVESPSPVEPPEARQAKPEPRTEAKPAVPPSTQTQTPTQTPTPTQTNAATPTAAPGSTTPPLPSPPADEPDTTSGGSIAARLAALKGAGMQVNVSTRRASRDMGAGASAMPVVVNGTTTSRRGSVASVHTASSTGVPSTPRTEHPASSGLESAQQTGSSVTSPHVVVTAPPHSPAALAPAPAPSPTPPGGPAPHPPYPHVRTSRSSTLQGKPAVIEEDDELAQFSSAFPSLVEFEGKALALDESEGAGAGAGAGAGEAEVARETARVKPPLPPTPAAKPASLAAAATINGGGSSSGTTKPPKSLPFTSAIMPDTLDAYLDDPGLNVLLVDTRPGQDHARGWIGDDGRDAREGVSCVWIDPTILSRPGLDSIKLENALSLSPPAEQRAFAARNTADLVVLYDARSTAFPKPGAAEPTAPGRLFSIIFENEFRRVLRRTPVLLVGGYEAWRRYVEQKQGQGQGQSAGAGAGAGYTAVAKGPPPVVATKKPSVVPESPETRALRRDTGVYRSSAYSRNITDNFNPPYPQSMVGLAPSYNGQPLIPHSSSASATTRSQPSAYSSSPYASAAPTPPPLASTSPGPLSRKRSDYVDQHNKPYSGYQGHHASRASVDYPQIHHHHHPHHPSIPQPPPAAATSSSERQDRPRPDRSASIISFDGLSRLPESDDMLYWNDAALGISGLKNLGNTCYMNSTLQCLSATYPLARFFRDGSFKRAINTVNPMGTKGDLAKAFATLISVLWNEQYTFLSPITFRKSISTYAPSFAGTDQHDSQEFLSFLLDGLHEDLNRIRTKPPAVEMTPEREAALETLPPSVAAEKEWQIYKQRNDSLIVDLFQGQYRNRMECLTCHKTSTTYDAFMYLSLPVPQGKQKVVLQELIDSFVQTEVMEKDDAWNCPRCKVPRKATKSLSIARLPPVLLIHLKRFTTTNGVFWDKSETPVIFPTRHLDLTRYIPPSPAQLEGKNPSGPADPTSTTGPFLYDLFAISNHMGSLSNGHYTAFVNSSKGWKYCDDSKITPASERDVVKNPAHAYILWYKRTLPPRTVPATAA